MDARKLVFILLFSGLVLVGNSINFSKLVGAENQFFTLFQFFGPIAGGFLGPLVGAASVLVAEIIDFVIKGKALEPINILRLAPMLFAAWYFGTKKDAFKDVSVAVPILAIAAFVLHPVGAQVWWFSLYWTIPLIVKFLPDRLFLRSLGATFTAHAVGGALWVWSVPMTPAQWNALIPIVAYERLLFALGITASYIAMNTLLSKVPEKLRAPHVRIDPRYLFPHVVVSALPGRRQE